MRYLWMTSFALLFAGVALIAAYVAGAAEVIALVAGVLLLWSAIVNVIVLRIWRWSLAAPGVTEGRSRIAASHRDGQSS